MHHTIRLSRISAITFLASLAIIAVLTSCSDDGGPTEPPTKPPVVAGSDWEKVSGPLSVEAITDIWGASASDIFAVGSSGSVFHFDGSKWDSVTCFESVRFNGVWGSSGSDVFAVSNDGEICHFDGVSWIMMESGTDEPLEDVAGDSPTNVYAVGYYGTVLHYDGISWTPVNTGHAVGFPAVSVLPSGTVFLATTKGILKSEGDGWTDIWPLADRCFAGVVGVSDSSVWVYDDNGTVYHWDGREFSDVSAHNSWQVSGMTGDATGTAFLVHSDGTVYRRTDTSWIEIGWLGESFSRGIWASDDSNIHVTMPEGFLAHYDGSEWTTTVNGAPTRQHLRDVWCSPGNQFFVVGDSGLILRYDGGVWEEMSSGVEVHLNSVWGTAEDNVYAVGAWRFEDFADDDDAVVLHYDGNEWRRAFEPDARELVGVHGSSASNVWALGIGSGECTVAYRFNGISWQQALDYTYVSSPQAVFCADSTATYAVGYSFSLKHDGQTWEAVEDSLVQSYYDFCGVSGLSDDFVVMCTSEGSLLVFDGTSWTENVTPTNAARFGLSVSAENDIYAVGWGGAMIHFDGADWTTVDELMPVNFNAVAQSTDGKVCVVGDYGTILLHEE